MSKNRKAAVALGKELADKNRRGPCIACNGTGRYDDTGSPKCGSCNGTGKEVEHVEIPRKSEAVWN